MTTTNLWDARDRLNDAQVEQLLAGTNPIIADESWEPGDPLYLDPRTRGYTAFLIDSRASGIAYTGEAESHAQHVRQMISDLPDFNYDTVEDHLRICHICSTDKNVVVV